MRSPGSWLLDGMPNPRTQDWMKATLGRRSQSQRGGLGQGSVRFPGPNSGVWGAEVGSVGNTGTSRDLEVGLTLCHSFGPQGQKIEHH